MSLLFSSCMKNYPEMVYEKALQYQQEGKYILGKSDDPSGKEHYIVYIDNKNIVVDDLVDSLRHYPLGNLKVLILVFIMEMLQVMTVLILVRMKAL